MMKIPQIYTLPKYLFNFILYCSNDTKYIRSVPKKIHAVYNILIENYF